MYRSCKTESAARRQRALESGFMELLCKRQYDDITVSQLCQHLQIPRRVFYRYFSGKDGALYALIDHTINDFYVLPHGGEKQAGTALGDLDLFFHFWHGRKPLLDALQRSGKSGILVERVNDFALREGMMPRQFKDMPDQVKEIAMAFVLCGLMSMILQWHRTGFALSPKEMSRLATAMLTKPLLQTPPAGAER